MTARAVRRRVRGRCVGHSIVYIWVKESNLARRIFFLGGKPTIVRTQEMYGEWVSFFASTGFWCLSPQCRDTDTPKHS